MPPRLPAALAGLLLLALVHGPAPSAAQELPFTHYTDESPLRPLPGAAVTVLHQDRLGYLWLGVYGYGLARYDGTSFEPFGPEQGLTGTNVWAVTEDADGRLWAGATPGGLFATERPLEAYEGAARPLFTDTLGGVPLERGPMQPTTGGVTAGPAGGLWFATRPHGESPQSTLLRYRAAPAGLRVDTLTLPAQTSAQVVAMTARRDGSVWVALEGGHLARYDSTAAQPTAVLEMPCHATGVLRETAAGTLWGGCMDGRLWRLTTADPAPRLLRDEALYDGEIRALHEDEAGRLWLGGLGGGIVVLDPEAPEAPTSYTRRHGLLDVNVWDVRRDREGNTWIAQNTGVSKLRADFRAFTRFTGATGPGRTPALPARDAVAARPWTAPAGPDGAARTLLAVATSGGLALVDPGGRAEHLTGADGLAGDVVMGACPDEAGGLWIAVRNGGAGYLTFGESLPHGAAATRRLSLFGRPARLARYQVSPVLGCYPLRLPADDTDRGAGLTCLAASPLHCVAEGRWFVFDAPGEAQINFPSDMRADRRGYLYVGTMSDGLFRSRRPVTRAALEAAAGPAEGGRHHLAEPFFERVPPAPGITAGQAVPIVAPVGRRVWVAGGEGLLALDDVTLTPVTRADTVVTVPTRAAALAADPGGEVLWVGTRQGLAEVASATATVRRRVGAADGLAGDVSWGPQAVTVAPDGAVYHASSTGLTRYRPDHDRAVGVAPSPRLRRLDYRENARGRNELVVEYAALSFADEDAVRYRTRLRGFDEDWSAETAETSIRYTNLGAVLVPRTYTFEVTARNRDGVWSEGPLTHAVTVTPAWWLRWWAFLAYTLVLGAAVLGVDRVQRRRLVRRERAAARARERELRAEAAEAWADALQAENARQTQELEQARALQLSMLPAHLPEHPAVELAAFMQTATEVGGDYYDYHLAPDGTLTLILGDATGHGLRAGTMVTAMKSLWNAMAERDDLLDIVERANRALRAMHLSNLYMAAALVRLRGDTLELVGAGMPAALVHRAAGGPVEAVPLKGMPLGGPLPFPYRRRCLTLAPGDTMVLMSDGLPELPGTDGDRLGYHRMQEVVARAVAAGGEAVSARGVATHLAETVRAWTDGGGPDDDVTFLVVRRHGPSAP